MLRIPQREPALRLSFPADYPEARPHIVGPESGGATLPKGEAHNRVERAEVLLESAFRKGEPCVFDLVEALTGDFEETSTTDAEQPHEEDGEVTTSQGQDDDNALPEGFEEPQWTLSEVVIEKKSVFVARAARVHDADTAKMNVRHLVATDRKAARATHNMTAWRIQGRGREGVVIKDCDDDGETAAGARLLHLLELTGVMDGMVVVSRWYGGVHLGPDRFRIINATARDALVRAGLVEQQAAKGKQSR